MWMHSTDKEALYNSIHRLAQSHIPDCTIEQVKKVAKRFHDSNTTRFQYAFVIYWEMAENRVEEWAAKTFLDMLRTLAAQTATDEQKEKAASIHGRFVNRDYWKS